MISNERAAELWKLFYPLYGDIRPEQQFSQQRPLLSHYTSFRAIEKILGTGDLWLSSPLLMNDFQEVRYGIAAGAEIVESNTKLRAALANNTRYDLFIKAYRGSTLHFANNEVLDLFIFCFSRHDSQDNDGKLSMWRAYGQNGQGVAIVFDSSKLPELASSPIMLAEVGYGSEDERRQALARYVEIFSDIIGATQISEDELFYCAHALFERVKLASVFMKGRGFIEEGEWRLVYWKPSDPNFSFKNRLWYSIADRGIEPKLRLNVVDFYKDNGFHISEIDIVDRIIVGPSTNRELSVASFKRVLECLNKDSLVTKVKGSTIPFRKP